MPTGTGTTPKRLYDTAYADYTAGQWSLAVQGFETYLKTYPKSDLADDAQYYVGESYSGDSKFREAVGAYERMIRDYPQSDILPEAWYKVGITYERLGAARQGARGVRVRGEDVSGNQRRRAALQAEARWPQPATALASRPPPPPAEDAGAKGSRTIMGSVNKVILVGNLGRDAELRYTPGGAAVATLNLATTETWNDKEGQRQEKTEWHRVILWGKQAETLNQYLQKGKQIYVEGRLQTRQWDDKDGNKRYTTEVRGDRVVLLSSGSGGGGQRSGGGGMRSEMPHGEPPMSRRRSPRTTSRSSQSALRDGSEVRIANFVLVVRSLVRVLPLFFPAVPVFQPHHIVELRRRDLHDVAVLDRRHAVHGAGRDVEALATARPRA